MKTDLIEAHFQAKLLKFESYQMYTSPIFEIAETENKSTSVLMPHCLVP